MQPDRVDIDPALGGHFAGSDGRLEVSIPAAAVSPADVASAGGKIGLLVRQVEPPSGSTGGGSGRYSFGAYLVQVVDGQGHLASHGLLKPVTLTLHYGGREEAVDTSHVYLVLNVPPPTGTALNPDPSGTTLTATQAGLGAVSSLPLTVDPSAGTLSATSPMSTPTMSASFNTNSPVATFGKPDIFTADTSAGALTTNIPLDLPPGVGGLVPPLALGYSSASVNEQHNAQGAAGWVGEGWNLAMGSITWAEHNVAGVWQDTWELNDPFGTSAQLVPPQTTVSTYLDDTGHGITPSPVYWRTVPESHTHIYSYVGSVVPSGMTRPAPCFRVYLQNGLMEEFGCTADSVQYYPTSGGNQYVFAWHLDLVTDRHGDQIHIGYAWDLATANGRAYPRDVVPQYVQWNSPNCRNGDTACPQSSSQWQPLFEVAFGASHTASYLDPRTPSCPAQPGNLRCDDPADWTSHGGLPAPEVQNTFVLNDIIVHVRSSGTAGWNNLHHYKLTYLQVGQGQVLDPISGLWQSVPGRFLLTQINELGDDESTALPRRSFGYVGGIPGNPSPQINYYEDSSPTAPRPRNCPSWWPSGCPLWSQSYDGNSWYLSSADNGTGLLQTFGWSLARPNTHGVNSGNGTNPVACGIPSPSSTYPCNYADDENWSRWVLTQQTGTVAKQTPSGPVNVISTTVYTYSLSQLAVHACSDCNYGFTWGDRTDNDYADFYNETFMGFVQARVSKPDGSVVTHIYPSTEGWGVWDVSRCGGWSYCSRAPWWDPSNALHGHEMETDVTDTNGTTLLRQVLTSYALTCPPAGALPSLAGQWANNVVAELDPDNPVAVCDVHVARVDTYEGGSATTTPPVPHRADAFTYDGDGTYYGRVTLETLTSNDGGAPGSPLTVVHRTEYVWNDHLNPQANSVTGVFLTTPVAFSDTEDGSASQAACQYSSYDGQAWQANVNSNAMALANLTQSDQSTNCGSTIAQPTPPAAITTKYGYDVWGNRVGMVDPDQHVSCLVGGVGQFTDCWYFDGIFDVFVVQHTNILGQVDLTFYDTTAGPSFGYGLWPKSTRDINSQSTTYRYDALGRLIGETLPGDPANANTVSYAYAISCGAAPQPPCVEVDMNQFLGTTPTSGPMVARRFYDGWGHLVETRGISAGVTQGSEDVVHFTDYDKSGRESARSVGYFIPQWSSGATYATPDRTQPVTSTSYDGLGRVIAVTDPLSHQTTTSYSVACNIAGDSACYLQTLSRDPLQHQAGAAVDAFGRTIYTQRFTGNQSSNYAVYATVQYTYDAAGRMTRILGPGVAQINDSYDTAGRKIGLVDPDRGTESYTYDANGNLTKSVNNRGAAGTTYIGYDVLNRPLWHNVVNSSTGAYETSSYDSGTNGVGRLTGETFNSGSLSGQKSYSYDNRGRLTSVNLTIGGASYPVQSTYTEAGQLATQTYPTGEVVTYGYGALSTAATGWLTSLSTQQGSTTTPLLGGVDYRGPGGAEQRITNATLGSGSGAYTYSATFDALARATDIKLSAAQTLFEQSRTFDVAGNVSTASTTLPTGTDNQAFCYDEQNRLTWAGAGGTPPCGVTLTPGSLTAAQYQQSFGYDNLGRLTNGPAGAYSYGSNPLHGVTAIGSSYTAAYDGAGNMNCRAPAPTATCAGGSPTGAKLTYDNEGRLTGWQNTPTSPSTTAAFLYDNEGNRVELQVTQSGTTTTTVYIGNIEQVVTSGSSTTTTTYYYANGQRIALAVNGVFSYLASDGLGSAMVALNASGSATASLLYAPYGGTRYSSGTMPTDYGFTGQHADNATGLDYYNARYYDPLAVQFTSADSVLPGGGYDILGLSRYAYVEGNPETLIDPSGNLACRVRCGPGWSGESNLPPLPVYSPILGVNVRIDLAESPAIAPEMLDQINHIQHSNAEIQYQEVVAYDTWQNFEAGHGVGAEDALLAFLAIATGGTDRLSVEFRGSGSAVAGFLMSEAATYRSELAILLAPERAAEGAGAEGGALRIFATEGRAAAAGRAGALNPGESGKLFATNGRYQYGNIAQSNLAMTNTRGANVAGYWEVPSEYTSKFTYVGRVQPERLWEGGGPEFTMSGSIPYDQLGPFRLIPWAAGQ